MFCSLLDSHAADSVNWDGHAATPPYTPTLLVLSEAWIISQTG